MNSHLHIAAGLLTAVTLLTAAGSFKAQHFCEKLIEKADAAQKTLSGGGDPAEAIGALETAWADTQHHLRLLMPNAPLMDLNEAIARLYPEYEQGSDGLSAELASIAADLSWLRDRCGFRVL